MCSVFAFLLLLGGMEAQKPGVPEIDDSLPTATGTHPEKKEEPVTTIFKFRGPGKAGEAVPGSVVIVTNWKKTYPTINTGNKLTWPSEQWKAEAGKEFWGDWKPSDGLTGEQI